MVSYRISTAFILSVMVLTFAFEGALLGHLIGFVVDGVNWYVGAIAMSLVALIVMMYTMVVPMGNPGKGCTLITEENNPRLFTIVDNLSKKAGVPTPRIYYQESVIPNAWAFGRNDSERSVAVEGPIMDILDDDELEGVMAHELSHIIHKDTIVNGTAKICCKVLTASGKVMGAVALISGMMLGGAASNSRSKDSGLFLLIMAVVLIPIIIVGAILYLTVPGAAMVTRFGVSRSREYGADESAARITGKPMALASGLMKMDDYCIRHFNPKRQIDPNKAHMYIVNPAIRKEKFINGLMRTHPTTQQRVERLKKLEAVMNTEAERKAVDSKQVLIKANVVPQTVPDTTLMDVDDVAPISVPVSGEAVVEMESDDSPNHVCGTVSENQCRSQASVELEIGCVRFHENCFHIPGEECIPYSDISGLKNIRRKYVLLVFESDRSDYRFWAGDNTDRIIEELARRCGLIEM